MGVSIPRENPWWWDYLRLGEASARAAAFDVDRAQGDGRVRLPILGAALAEAIGEITIDPTPAPDAPRWTRALLRPRASARSGLARRPRTR